LALRWRFVLLSVLSLARCGSFLCLLSAESSRWRFVRLFFWRSLFRLAIASKSLNPS
jgi:hypothetical protein